MFLTTKFSDNNDNQYSVTTQKAFRIIIIKDSGGVRDTAEALMLKAKIYGAFNIQTRELIKINENSNKIIKAL